MLKSKDHVRYTLNKMEITKARYSAHVSRNGSRKPFKLTFFAVILLIILSLGGYAYAAIKKPLPKLSIVKADIKEPEQEEFSINWPVRGQAAIGSFDEGVLTVSPGEKAQPIASMTKLITALAVLDKSPLETGEQGRTYTIDAEDISLYRSYVAKSGSVLPVREGQQLTQYQALQALLLPSANNIADMLVRHHFGGMEEYVAYANAMIKKYGLNDTIVADASGFSPQSVSTPSDMIIIGQKALSNPLITDIVGQKSAVIPGSGLIRNTNRLLGEQNVIGLKTGNTDEAGYCLLFAANLDLGDGHDTTVIGVVMGIGSFSQLFPEASRVLASAKNGFGKIELLPAGTETARYSSAWGEGGKAVTKDSLSIYGWKHHEFDLQVKIEETPATVESNSDIGDVFINGYEDVKVDIYANEPVENPGNLWKLANFF